MTATGFEIAVYDCLSLPPERLADLVFKLYAMRPPDHTGPLKVRIQPVFPLDARRLWTSGVTVLAMVLAIRCQQDPCRMIWMHDQLVHHLVQCIEDNSLNDEFPHSRAPISQIPKSFPMTIDWCRTYADVTVLSKKVRFYHSTGRPALVRSCTSRSSLSQLQC